MKAINQEEHAWQECLVESVMAGCDLLLVCQHLERVELAIEGLRRKADKDPVFARRLREAALRVSAFRKLLPNSSLSGLGRG